MGNVFQSATDLVRSAGQAAAANVGQGRAVLITGASSGIGVKTAEVLAANGFYVYAGARKQADLDALDYDRSEVEELVPIPFSFFMDTPPETYVLTVETQPFRVQDGARIHFAARELGLPEMYHRPWRGRDRTVYLYRYGERVVWGIAGEIVYETVQRAKEALNQQGS